MELKELDALLKLLKRHGVSEFTLDEDKTTMSVTFSGGGPAPTPAAFAQPAVPAPSASAPAPAPRAVPASDIRTIRAPIVGTFYRSPSPEAPAYVNVGDRVRKGQVVCIVEAMKLMNQIESDVDGVVVEILIENAQAVQFSQELFRLSPA